MSLNFTKMHGCGNDFLIIDLRNQTLDLTKDKVRQLADYKKAIGFDQLITIENSNIADIGIRIFNNDGSEVAACGNGSRCVAKLIIESSNKINITISTSNRIITAKRLNNLISINMGKAEVIARNIKFGEIAGSLVEIGNPHIVINNISNLDPLVFGPLIENDQRFPNKVNVNFAKIIDRNLVALSTWERGAGATLACGSGACATFFLLYKQGLVNKEAVISQLGGDLTISIENEDIIMAGEAHISYRGII